MAADRSRLRRFPGWTGSSAGQVATAIATTNSLLSVPFRGQLAEVLQEELQ
jgi:hypothetical protein